MPRLERKKGQRKNGLQEWKKGQRKNGLQYINSNFQYGVLSELKD